ncbi:MAG: hypothetical protein IPN94_22050 [Sphingobacteriales bacterium]|nr:hypothetical protein [Sphingobacteriales bacterium]
MKNHLNLAEASKLTQLSERSLRRIAKQLLSEQSSDVRSIKTKTGFRYELSLSYLTIHLSRNFWKFLGVSEIRYL